MRASGRACCRRSPARPCWDGTSSPRSVLPPPAFCMAWLAAEPGEDLVEAGGLALALGRAQCRIGDEQDALVESDRRALAEARQWLDEQALLAERRPVAPRILDQHLGLRDPQGAAPALEPVVED